MAQKWAISWQLMAQTWAHWQPKFHWRFLEGSFVLFPLWIQVAALNALRVQFGG